MATRLDGVGSLQEQVRRSISREIAEGDYPPGAQLPTEREYAGRLGVSLITVRHALASLVQTGYIERASGRGTFVSGPKIPYHLPLVPHSTAGLQAAGVPFEVEVVQAGPGEPPDDVRRALALARTASAYHLERVAVVPEGPAILLDSWIRRSVARAIERRTDFTRTESLYSLLAGLGIALSRAEGRLELIHADDRAAELLRLQWGAPLFAYDSVTRDETGRPIERTRSLFDANRSALTISAHIAPP